MIIVLQSLWQLSLKPQFLQVVKASISRYSEKSILPEQKEGSGFKDVENELYEAVIEENLEEIRKSLEKLRYMHRGYGKNPIKGDSGYFEIIHFLNNLEETMIVVLT